jgi:hypothetical protein
MFLAGPDWQCFSARMLPGQVREVHRPLARLLGIWLI